MFGTAELNDHKQIISHRNHGQKQAIKLAKELTTHQCINEKFISLQTSQKVSKRTLLRFSKRDNNKRQSVINPSAIFVGIITAVHLFLVTVEEMEGVGGGGTEVTIAHSPSQRLLSARGTIMGGHLHEDLSICRGEGHHTCTLWTSRKEDKKIVPFFFTIKWVNVIFYMRSRT